MLQVEVPDLANRNRLKSSTRMRNRVDDLSRFPILRVVLLAIFVACSEATQEEADDNTLYYNDWCAPHKEFHRTMACLIEKSGESSMQKSFKDALVNTLSTIMGREINPVLACETWFQSLQEHEVKKGTLFDKADGTRVYKCEDTIMPPGEYPTHYVVKRLTKDEKTTRRKETSSKIESKFTREICAYMEMGEHPNIIDFHSAWEDNQYFYLVLECGANNFSKITGVDEKKVQHYGKSMIKALVHSYSKGVPHRDLKPENIVFSQNKKCLKLIDFGEGDMQEHGSVSDPAERLSGTPGYLAPEILEQYDWINDFFRTKEFKVGMKAQLKRDFRSFVEGDVVKITEVDLNCPVYRTLLVCKKEGSPKEETIPPSNLEIGYAYSAEKVDVFTLGICLWQMLVTLEHGTNHPFEASKFSKSRKTEEGTFSTPFIEMLHKNIQDQTFDPIMVHAERIKHLSPSAIGVLRKCFQRDPAKRPTLKQLSKDPWIRPPPPVKKRVTHGSARRQGRRPPPPRPNRDNVAAGQKRRPPPPQPRQQGKPNVNKAGQKQPVSSTGRRPGSRPPPPPPARSEVKVNNNNTKPPPPSEPRRQRTASTKTVQQRLMGNIPSNSKPPPPPQENSENRKARRRPPPPPTATRSPKTGHKRPTYPSSKPGGKRRGGKLVPQPPKGRPNRSTRRGHPQPSQKPPAPARRPSQVM